jgi:hypothetical protein
MLQDLDGINLQVGSAIIIVIQILHFRAILNQEANESDNLISRPASSATPVVNRCIMHMAVSIVHKLSSPSPIGQLSVN